MGLSSLGAAIGSAQRWPLTVVALTDKLINIAIFWLPLIGGTIFFGLASNVWTGGHKIVALWMIFVGAVLWLITLTFQIQIYIQTTVLQPQLELEPTQRSILTWNPLDSSMNIRGENDQFPPGHWRTPTFIVRNKSQISAQDIRIDWQAVKYDPVSLIANNSIFQTSQASFDSNSLVLSTPGGMSFQHPFEFSASLEKPFITPNRPAEIFLPLSIWNTAALFLISDLPVKSGERSQPYYFDLKLSWALPEGGKTQEFRVKATATSLTDLNAGPPFRALVEFSIEKPGQ